MKRSMIYLSLTILGLSLYSCQKNTPAKNNSCTLSEANLVGTYKYDSVFYKATPTSAAIESSDMVDACSLDDIVTFKSDHTFIFDDGTLQCDPSDSGTGSWSLNGNVLTVGPQSGKVNWFDCTHFVVAHKDFVQAGDTLLITFKRQ